MNILFGGYDRDEGVVGVYASEQSADEAVAKYNRERYKGYSDIARKEKHTLNP